MAKQEHWIGDRYAARRDPPSNPARPTFHYRDADHTPMNKRAGEVEATAYLRVESYNGDKPWLAVELEELTTGPSGRVVSRSISVNLSGDARQALLEMLQCK